MASPISIRFIWRGPELSATLVKQVKAGMEAWQIDLQAIAREKTSIINAGVRKTRQRATVRGAKGSQYTVYPHPSKRGESVRRRTGFGQKNIIGANEGLSARVGYTRNAAYMLIHELRGRPTLVPAFRDNRTRLDKIFQNAAEAAG